MILYQVLTNLYVLDYFYNEPKMITTWDIIAERFGFMLVVCALTPLLYSPLLFFSLD